MNHNNDIDWLVEHSMLAQGEKLSAQESGKGAWWQRPYAEAQPRALSDVASVWLTTYPAAIVTADGESVLATLADPKLWQALAQIGINGLHTGPMKQAGSVKGQEFGPTVDGHFDRIMLRIDPIYGSEQEYLSMIHNAQDQGLTLIGDIIPGHTGMGADFQLALRRYREYAGLYHMVEIAREDWSLLPAVEGEQETANLRPETVDILKEKGYIVGQLARVIFYEPGVKETNWSATGIVQGVDGIERRWVYLHYFKAGQPS